MKYLAVSLNFLTGSGRIEGPVAAGAGVRAGRLIRKFFEPITLNWEFVVRPRRALRCKENWPESD